MTSPPGQKVRTTRGAIWFYAVFFYILVGNGVAVLMAADGVGGMGLHGHTSGYEYLAIMLFWPAFAVKYLFIGISSLLTTFVHLISL